MRCQVGPSSSRFQAPRRACKSSRPSSRFSRGPADLVRNNSPKAKLLPAPHSPRGDGSVPVLPHPNAERVSDREDTAHRLKSYLNTCYRPACSSRDEYDTTDSDHSRPSLQSRSGTASRIAPTPTPAPGSPRAARGPPRVPPRCARGPRRRATAARGRRRLPSGATAGLPPAPPPPRARFGSSCTPSGALGRANRCVDSPSNSTYGFASRRDRATPPTVRERRDGAGTHCVVPHGQFSKVFGFAPQIVQVRRSLSAFARALTCSNSRCFFSHSFIPRATDERATNREATAGTRGVRTRRGAGTTRSTRPRYCRSLRPDLPQCPRSKE